MWLEHLLFGARPRHDARGKWVQGSIFRSVFFAYYSAHGCDSATSSVVENAAATFNPLTWQGRYWIPHVDTLAAVAVPGYKNSHERAEYVSNKLERADTTFYERRYLLEVKAQLDALTESDFTVPNFTGTPQW